MDLSLAIKSPVFEKERAALTKGLGSHAYIIEGAKGIGKTSFALAASCVRFCTGESKPCFTCPSCRKVLEGVHPDVHIFEPDRKLFRVEQARQIISTLYESAYEGGAKIYILKDFHLANDPTQNALLKSLEEPPRSVSFFLLVENSYKLLDTVRSRCKSLHLSGFSEADILAFLTKRYGESDKVRFAAAQAMGNVGNAIRLIEDEEYIRLNGVAEDIVKNADKLTEARLAFMFEKEKDGFDCLLDILEGKLFNAFRKDGGTRALLMLKAVQDASDDKKKNINSGLVAESLAYSLAKGGNKWQR